jgi:hypothetical protein
MGDFVVSAAVSDEDVQLIRAFRLPACTMSYRLLQERCS